MAGIGIELRTCLLASFFLGGGEGRGVGNKEVGVNLQVQITKKSKLKTMLLTCKK